MSLRTRIAAVAGVSVALAVLVVAVGLYVAVSTDLRGEVDKGLRERARPFAQPPPGSVAGAAQGGAEGPGPQPLFGDEPPPGGPPPGAGGESGPGGLPRSVQPAPFGGASGYVQFLATNGTVRVPGGQGSSSASISTTALDRSIARRGSGSALTSRTVRGMKLRVLTQGIGTRGAVMVARPLGEVDSELNRLVAILAIVGAVGIALAAGLGAVVARVALAPVRRFTARTETLTEEGALRGASLDLSRRMEVEGSDELGRLADSFNRTLDALERSARAQRRLVADAGHELRTPIASLRANIQVLGEAQKLPVAEQESLRNDIIGEFDELTALVADVVELARGTSSEGRQADDVRLDAIVAAAIEKAVRRGGVRFERRLEPTVVIGQAERIDRAVNNLLENARKWSPEGGLVEVALRDGVLSVRDHGPGFDEQDVPHVFDRFYRADGARGLPGSGLGLAIVRQAAEACGGYAEAGNADGGGALLRVSFGPRAGFAAGGG
ncbi:MAG TPA: HAMP domain-containing sensor histidine kinase [Solirubrobacteraceae bacterium]|jgi:two-component system sensor histidine kinase MprB